MGNGTGLGRVRGLGSAKHGGGHWVIHRMTAIGTLLLMLWLLLFFFVFVVVGAVVVSVSAIVFLHHRWVQLRAKRVDHVEGTQSKVPVSFCKGHCHCIGVDAHMTVCHLQ